MVAPCSRKLGPHSKSWIAQEGFLLLELKLCGILTTDDSFGAYLPTSCTLYRYYQPLGGQLFWGCMATMLCNSFCHYCKILTGWVSWGNNERRRELAWLTVRLLSGWQGVNLFGLTQYGLMWWMSAKPKRAVHHRTVAPLLWSSKSLRLRPLWRRLLVSVRLPNRYRREHQSRLWMYRSHNLKWRVVRWGWDQSMTLKPYVPLHSIHPQWVNGRSRTSLVIRPLLNQRLSLTIRPRRWWSSTILLSRWLGYNIDLCSLLQRRRRAYCTWKTCCSMGPGQSKKILRYSFEFIFSDVWRTHRGLVPEAQKIFPILSLACGETWTFGRTRSWLSRYEF